jgi:inositol phosphorylceramide mannosyltransferase catalytic subunit
MQIPKVFHQVWVGPSPLPDEFARYQQTWLDHHPGWELRYWTEGDLPANCRRPEAYEKLRSPTERSDLLRYELLWQFGGVYVDADFECLRSIEPLLEGVDFFVAEIEPGRVNGAIMGSVPGHEILDRALVEVKPREFHGYDKDATGPLFFDRLRRRFPEITIFEKDLFYSKAEDARQRAYAIHHAATSWKDEADLRREVEKARAHESKARAQADKWRAKYKQSEATLARLRRPLAPTLTLRRLLKRR